MIQNIKNLVAFKLINLGISMLDKSLQSREFISNCILTGHIVLREKAAITNNKQETIIRNQFDVFANELGLRIDRDEDEIYIDLLTHKCWLTWKAAVQSIDS